MGYGMNDDWSTTVVSAILLLGLMAGAVFVPTRCSYNDCSDICSTNKDEAHWTWTQGCFCKDDDGLYNPKDER